MTTIVTDTNPYHKSTLVESTIKISTFLIAWATGSLLNKEKVLDRKQSKKRERRLDLRRSNRTPIYREHNKPSWRRRTIALRCLVSEEQEIERLTDVEEEKGANTKIWWLIKYRS